MRHCRSHLTCNQTGLGKSRGNNETSKPLLQGSRECLRILTWKEKQIATRDWRKRHEKKRNRGELFMVSSSGNFRVFLSGPRAIHSGRAAPLSAPCKTICPISQRMDGHFPGAKYICFHQPVFGTTTFLSFMSSIF